MGLPIPLILCGILGVILCVILCGILCMFVPLKFLVGLPYEKGRGNIQSKNTGKAEDTKEKRV
jgi:hypothetical protein